MADSELQNLTADTAPASGDIVYVVVDPTGSPLARKMTVDNLMKALNILSEDTAPAPGSDYGLTYDTSASAAKKVLLQRMGTLDGWIPDAATWTYASATTFTVSGDVTAQFRKGTKLNLTQTTVKYFYVRSSSYGAPNTTVTVTGGSDYTLANAAITLPYYSYADCPQGFPGWFNWTPTLVGFSADPANATYRFAVHDTTVILAICQGTAGTSNGTTLTMTLPITAETVTNHQWGGVVAIGVDNGAEVANPAWIIPSAGTTANFYKSGVAAWTNSGGKCVAKYGGTLIYEMT